MITTKVFQNGNSQALRIPQEYRTEKKEYCITKIGDILIAYPSDDPWAPAKLALDSITPDFLIEREQPDWSEVSKREEL